MQTCIIYFCPLPYAYACIVFVSALLLGRIRVKNGMNKRIQEMIIRET